MPWVRTQPTAFGFLLAFYLLANLGLSSTAIRSWLVARSTGMAIPECGCLDADCQCGAPCCSPEAKRLRATAGNDQPPSRTAPDCCESPSTRGGPSCCQVNDYQEMILRSACTCGNARLHLGLIAGDSHVFPRPFGMAPPPLSTPAHQLRTPELCRAQADPPDKIPKT